MTDKPRAKVVVAEDDAIIRMDLREMLEEESYEVLETGDGASAIELVRGARPDLVILDVKMPIMDGITAAQHITEESLAPVVILTAYSQRELVERAAAAGAMAYLVKPFQKQDLLPAIEVARGRYQQLQTLAAEVGDLSQRLEARKLVERAKGHLSDAYGMSENDAFRFIQETAMNRRLRLDEVARSVLDGTVRADS